MLSNIFLWPVSKLESMAIYVVNQACGNDIRACVYMEGSIGLLLKLKKNGKLDFQRLVCIFHATKCSTNTHLAQFFFNSFNICLIFHCNMQVHR